MYRPHIFENRGAQEQLVEELIQRLYDKALRHHWKTQYITEKQLLKELTKTTNKLLTQIMKLENERNKIE